MRLLFFGFMLLVAPLSHAAEAIDETRPATADTRIRFHGVEGKIHVKPGRDDQWRLSGDLSGRVDKVDISGDAASWRIDVEYANDDNRWDFGFLGGKKGGKKGGNTDLTLEVPPQARLDVEVVSAEVIIGELRGPSLELTSVSGRVISSATPEYLEADTVSGDIELNAAGSRESRLQSVSGDIEINDGAGDIEVSVVSGDITIHAMQLRRADLQAVSGDLDITAEPASDSRIEIESHSGDVKLTIPDHLPLDLEVETFSGSIRSDWGQVQREDRGPGNHLRFRQGEASAKIEINAFSGDVSIRGQ